MVAVLYEDRRGDRNQFGFHRFICQCVLDRTPGFASTVYHAEKLVKAIVCKGNGNVFNKCKKDLTKLANQFRKIIAVYDQDKINVLINLKGRQCRSILREKLAEPCELKDSLEIVLIHANIEAVIEAIRDSGHAGSIGADCFRKAIAKDMNARDSLFIQCANLPKEARDNLLAILPDVNRLVTKIVEYR